MKPYPVVVGKTLDEHSTTLQFICRQRQNDISEFNNLVNTLVRGRKVDKVPTGSVDVAATDSIGDINYTTSYLYILVDNAGTAEWRRVALSSW